MTHQTGQGWPASSAPKKRRTGLIVLAVVLAVGLLFAGCVAVVVGAVDESADEAADGGISAGLGSQDATKDVKLGPLGPDVGGIREGTVEIVNHSRETSDYYVELRVLDAAGVNVGMANATAHRVRPGRKAKAPYVVAEDGAAKVEVTEVQRTASS